MNTLKVLAVAAAATFGMGTAAMAADLVVPGPAAVMTSGWDGGYIGVDGSVYTGPGVQADVFAGANFTVSESFLIGAEASLGIYNNLPGLGVELSGSVRGGFIVSDSVLLYGKLGGAFDFPGTRVFIGGGAEFKVSDSTAIRVEGTADNTGTLQATVGALWHF